MCLEWKRDRAKLPAIRSVICERSKQSAGHGTLTHDVPQSLISYISITAINLTFLIQSPQWFHLLGNFISTDCANGVSCVTQSFKMVNQSIKEFNSDAGKI